VIDRDRILARLDQVEGYLRELGDIAPSTFEEYLDPRTRRACERLLQIAIEGVLDTAALLVRGLNLGLPQDEDDLLTRLTQAGVITSELEEKLRKMKGLRNILVHEYGRVDDRIVYEAIRTRLGDFDEFKRAVLTRLSP
jgi:uncharacterized protein YutE (UPF0331/DUF86 family)